MNKVRIMPYLLSIFCFMSYADASEAFRRLSEIVQKGDMAALRECKAKNEDLSITDDHGNTLIHVAARCGQKEAIAVLSTNKEYPWYYYASGYIVYRWCTDNYIPSIDAQNNDGDTPLHVAVAHRRVESLVRLIYKGADRWVANKKGLTPFAVAIEADDALIIQSLIFRDIEVEKIKDANVLNTLIKDVNSLVFAIQNNKLEATKVLAKYAELRDSFDRNGCAAMHHATKCNNKEALLILKEHGADIDQKDARGHTPLNYAYAANNDDMSAFLRQHNANPNVKDNSGATELHRATLNNDVSKVQQLFADGLNPNEQRNDGYTPLHLAMQKGFSSLVDIYIAKKVDTCLRTQDGLTAFALGIDYGRISEVKKIEAVSAINSTDKKGRTSLLRAVRKNRVDVKEVVTYLLSIGADATIVDREKQSVLHAAASTDNVFVLSALLRAPKIEAMLNAQNKKGETPLHCVGLTNNVRAGEMLLTYGAQLNIRDATSFTPIHRAATGGHKEAIGLFCRYNVDSLTYLTNKGDSPLHLAMRIKHTACVGSLAHAAIINTKNKAGHTPLLEGVISGISPSSLTLVVNCGADVASTDDEGNTCIHLAINHNNNRAQQLFVEDSHFAQLINQKNSKGLVPLHIATSDGKLESVKMLLKHRSLNINIQNNAGASALSLAAGLGHKEIMDYLIAHKADLNLKDNSGYAPIGYAAYNGRLASIHRLEAVGALADQYNRNGQNSMHIAAMRGHQDIFDYYKEKWGDAALTIRDNEQKTPFMLASINGHVGIARAAYQERDFDDAQTLLNDARAGYHYGMREFLKSVITQKNDACEALFNRQAAIRNLAQQNKLNGDRVKQQAIKEFSPYMHTYISSGYVYQSTIPLSQINRWTSQQRAQLHAQLDGFYQVEIDQKQHIERALAAVARKQEEIKQAEHDHKHYIETQDRVYYLINTNAQQASQLTQLQAQAQEPGGYIYTPSLCASIQPFSANAIYQMDNHELKQYTRRAIQCQNHELQEKTRIEQRTKTIREVIEEQERKKHAASEALKAGTMPQAEQPTKSVFAAPAAQPALLGAAAQAQQAVGLEQLRTPNSKKDCCSCRQDNNDADEQGRGTVALHRLPCPTCKKGSSRICQFCSKTVAACPLCRGIVMNDFTPHKKPVVPAKP